jgi:hypothetical protein
MNGHPQRLPRGHSQQMTFHPTNRWVVLALVDQYLLQSLQSMLQLEVTQQQVPRGQHLQQQQSAACRLPRKEEDLLLINGTHFG